jgi:hypothetical protein
VAGAAFWCDRVTPSSIVGGIKTAERAHVDAAYPNGPSRLNGPGLIYVRVRPTWIRYSYSVDPPEIVEFSVQQPV